MSPPEKPKEQAAGGVEVTVLFATYNGAKTLPRMLEALTQQTLAPDRWKLVAVDNNSRDATQQILAAYRDRLPLEIVFEPRQGKQHALTTGFAHLEGDLLILTDDDVIPDPDWIEQFLAVAAEQPGAGIFGGLIEPEWERQPPSWVLRDAHLGVLYALNGELPEGPISAALVSGPNSAFRRSIIDGGYIVHDGLGPDASVRTFPMGEDTAFALRLERRGAKTFHSRRPRVRHIIRAGYVDEPWMLERAERYGMGLVTIRPEQFARKPKFDGMPVAATLLWAAWWPLTKVLEAMPRGQRRFRMLWTQGIRQGVVRQFWTNRSRRDRSDVKRGPSTGSMALSDKRRP